MLDRPEEYEKMAVAEQGLWWYAALHRLVLDALRRHGVKPGSGIVDVGCGTGGLLMHLRDDGYGTARGFDISGVAVDICRARGLNVSQTDMRAVGAALAPATVDVLISNDTLCFLDPQEQMNFAEQCRNVLRPGGLLIMNMPALKAFSGIHDLSVGIRERFSRTTLQSRLQSHFEVLTQTYWPFFLSPAIFAVRAAQSVRLRMNPRARIKSDLETTPRMLNGLLTAVALLENRLLRQKPFGSSLFVVARARTG